VDGSNEKMGAWANYALHSGRASTRGMQSASAGHKKLRTCNELQSSTQTHITTSKKKMKDARKMRGECRRAKKKGRKGSKSVDNEMGVREQGVPVSLIACYDRRNAHAKGAGVTNRRPLAAQKNRARVGQCIRKRHAEKCNERQQNTRAQKKADAHKCAVSECHAKMKENRKRAYKGTTTQERRAQ